MKILFDSSSSDIEKNKDYERLNKLFLKLKRVNKELLSRSNSKGNSEVVTIEEAMKFYISSFGLSFINCIFLNLRQSLGQIMNIRCIIEGVAILEYLPKLDACALEVFRLQSYIFERNIYNRYQELDGKMFYLEQINQNYHNIIKRLKDELNLEEKTLNKRIKSRVPFLGIGILDRLQ